jgi:hypothetical protein
MVGVFALHHFAKVNLHIRPTRTGSNNIGGLLFGAGLHSLVIAPVPLPLRWTGKLGRGLRHWFV